MLLTALPPAPPTPKTVIRGFNSLMSKAQRIIQMGTQVTQGLGAGSQPDVGAAAAQEVLDEIRDHLSGANMVFVTAGMGGGTGTGAAPVIAKTARDMGILTVGVVTKPFHFEGQRRMRTAEAGIAELHKVVDTLLIIPNQNLFRVANEKTTYADAFPLTRATLDWFAGHYMGPGDSPASQASTCASAPFRSTFTRAQRKREWSSQSAAKVSSAPAGAPPRSSQT